MNFRCVFVLPLALAASLVAAGCGGSDESSAEAWAGSVCAEANDWADEVDAALDTVADRGLALDEKDVREAADRLADATDELGTGLEELGPPETDSGGRAQEELDTLSAELREQLDEIGGALVGDQEPLEVVAPIATALAAAANQLQESLDSLERLDPAGELAEGFRNSDECEALRERIAAAGS